MKNVKIGDLKLKNGVWHNDTGEAVSVNPPGVIVGPDQLIKVSSDGAVSILEKSKDAPARKPYEPSPPVKHK